MRPRAGGDQRPHLGLDPVRQLAVLERMGRHGDIGHQPGRRAEHQDAVGEENRLIDAVGHDQEGGGLRLRQGLEVLAQPRCGDIVERAESLVEQHQFGTGGERTRDVDPLAHAARQFPRQRVLEAGQAHGIEPLRGLRPPLGLAHALDLQSERRIVGGGEPRQQPVLLEDAGDVAFLLAHEVLHRAAVDPDLAGVKLLQPEQAVEQHGFSGAGRPHDRDVFAGPHREAEVGDRRHLAAAGLAKALAGALHQQLWRLGLRCGRCNGHRRLSSIMAVTFTAPAQRDPLGVFDGLGHEQRHQHQDDGPGQHGRHVEHVLGEIELLADAERRADEFGDDDGAHRVADIELGGGEGGGLDIGPQQQAHMLDRIGAERQHHVGELAIDAPHAIINAIDRHRGAQHHQHEADAKLRAGEPDDDDDHPVERRHPHDELHDRPQELIGTGRQPHDQTDRNADHKRGRDGQHQASPCDEPLGQQVPGGQDGP